MNKRTREGTGHAVEHFQKALTHDPNDALAYAGLADSYRGLPNQADVPPGEAFPKAREAALKALEIDDRLSETHSALGLINFWEWDWEGAGKECRGALAVDPNNAQAHLGQANLLSVLGRHEDALKEIGESLKLDPLSYFLGVIKGQLLFQARRYPEAIEDLCKTRWKSSYSSPLPVEGKYFS